MADKLIQIKKRFLERYAELGTISAACEGLCARDTYYKWLENDKGGKFAKQCEVAAKKYVEKLEKEADRRAVEGVDKGIYHNGKLVDKEKRYSDTLLIFRLKRLDPQYRDRTEISGPDGGPLSYKITVESDREKELAEWLLKESKND